MNTNAAAARTEEAGVAEARNILIWMAFWIAALMVLLPALAGN